MVSLSPTTFATLTVIAPAEEGSARGFWPLAELACDVRAAIGARPSRASRSSAREEGWGGRGGRRAPCGSGARFGREGRDASARAKKGSAKGERRAERAAAVLLPRRKKRGKGRGVGLWRAGEGSCDRRVCGVSAVACGSGRAPAGRSAGERRSSIPCFNSCFFSVLVCLAVRLVRQMMRATTL